MTQSPCTRRSPFQGVGPCPGRRRSRSAATTGLVIGLAVVLAACSSSSSGSSSSAKAASDASIGVAGTKPVTTTVGPNGESSVPASTVTLSAADIATLKTGHYTAAMAWHETATFTTAVTAGANAEFKSLGIKVVATTQANFDAATQVNQLQTIETQKPSVVLSLPVNPVTEANAYKKVTASGSKLVLLSNVPTGLQYGTGYSGMVTDDLSAMGKQAAELLGKAMGGKGSVGLIYYDANYYVTNERDAAFRTWLGKLYPKITIVAQEAMPDSTKAEAVATAMMQRNPGIKGIYVPFSTPPAQQVIAGLRSLGTSTGVKIVTLDLDPAVDANLCSGKYLAGIVADQPYLLGQTLAKEAGLALLHKTVPKFAVVEALSVTKSNILSAWKTTLSQTAPENIRTACS